MKYSRFALLFASMVAFSVPAMAASVVMVQFGSFETQPEAEKRLADVKAAHPDLINGLGLNIKEVKLPPDNLTVFRTQAGPLDSRATAQALCTKFASSGDECYVVETAVTGTPATALQLSAAPIVPVAPLSPPMTPAAPAPPAVPQPMAQSSTVDSAASHNVVIPPNVSAMANGDASLPSSVLIPPPSVVATPVTTTSNTASALPALAPLAPPVLASTNSSSTTPPPASPELQAAMDRAVLAQNNGDQTPAPAPAPAATPAAKPTFWSRMNPFGSKTENTAKPAPSYSSTSNASYVAAPAVVPVTVAAAEPAPTPNNMIVLPTNPANAAAGDAPAMHLLPPPAPLTSQDKQYLSQQSTAPVPMPVMITPAPQPTPLMDPAPITPGSVRVEEAKRVPLSEAVAPPPAQVAMAAPSVSLMPSATLGQKTLWAQLGQFSDAQAALAYWQHYRETHPDFPAVRVRVVSSMQQREHGNDRAWLRVGPFGREGSIRNLCSNIHAIQDNFSPDLKCGNVTDLGIAGTAAPATGYLNGSRYSR